MKKYLEVPYSERELAKKHGAKWDSVIRKWYVDIIDEVSIARWIPNKHAHLRKPHKETNYEKEQRLFADSKLSKVQLRKKTKNANIVKPDEPVIHHGTGLLIYTDGSCYPNPGPGGWGWHRSDGVKHYGGEKFTTNNRMEMMAILNALIELPDNSIATVHSDSQYCVKGLTEWRIGWKKKSWKKKGEPMINRDLWVSLEDHVERLKLAFKWVKGHNGDPNNELADQLAGMGRRVA